MAGSRKRINIFETRYFGLLIGILVVAIIIFLSVSTGIFSTLEMKMLDVYFNYKNVVKKTSIQEGVSLEERNPQISPDILIVGIDLGSLGAFGKWPFPRYREANLVDNFARIKNQTQRERALFLDIFFIEPDEKAHDDVILIDSIRNNGRVFLETVLDEVPPPSASADEYFKRHEVLYQTWGEVTNISGKWEYMMPFFGVQPPLQPFAAATKGYGHANFAKDVDGIYRRQPLVAKSSVLIEEIRLENLAPDTPLDREKFERIEWVDKDGIHHNIPYPLTESVIRELTSSMDKRAPKKVVDLDNDGSADDEFFIVRKYRDHFIPSITLSLALQYFNKTLADIEVVLGDYLLIPDPLYFDVDSNSWVPYRITEKAAVFDEEGQIIEEAETRPVDEIRIPIDEQGQMLVNFMGPPSLPGSNQTFPIRSFFGYASSVTSVDPARWPRTKAVENKLVMVGAFARGIAEDQKPTPYGLMYGVEIHANALNTIIMENFLKEVPYWIDIAILIFLVMLIAYMASRLPTVWSLVSSIVLVLALFITVSIVFDQTSYIVSFSGPAIGVLFAFLSVVVYRIMTEEKDKKRIKDMFGKYVSPEVVDQILDDPPELGGLDKDLTVFFSDIRGFTSLSEMMQPQELVNHLNLYLTAMTDIIMEYEGTLDKYVGDEIMCFWGAPLPQADHAILACKCALRQMQKLHELNDGWPEERRINIGIGLNSGIMTVGNMGSLGRMSYTLTGDPVNLGARLEGTNKQYITNIIISEYTYGLVRDKVVVRELDNIRVKGKNKPVLIYELIDAVDGLESNILAENGTKTKKRAKKSAAAAT
ncbi:MAG: adenylate/guanylate cyclase domain-containing protein [Spirochaetales bacterium]|nr:adenylate/guanylate cyclase domain-containing protein [Spirochaetales bacterium]